MSQYLFGKNPVLTLLEQCPDRIFKIFLLEDMKSDKKLHQITRLAQDNSILYQWIPKPKFTGLLSKVEVASQEPLSAEEFNNRLPNAQGVIASVADKPLWDIHQLIDHCKPLTEAGQHPTVLVLDGITDPMNFGAILRVADATGVSAVILEKHHSPSLSPTVSKASSGADQVVNLVVTHNLTQALQKLKDVGFWVVGSSLSEKAQPYQTVDYAMPTVLILGSEGKGMGPLVESHCDFLVQIPMLGKIQSLNVATAASVLLYRIAQDSPRYPVPVLPSSASRQKKK